MLLARAVALWAALMTAEVAHGVARTLLLLPVVGDLRSRQIGVLTGSLVLFGITFVCVRWLRAETTAERLGIGALWAALTFAFELTLGRLVFDLSWDRLLADYRLSEGGLMPLGLAVLVLSPWLAARWRG